MARSLQEKKEQHLTNKEMLLLLFLEDNVLYWEIKGCSSQYP